MNEYASAEEERWIPPITVAPEDGESIRGLLLRYCDENGWPTLRQFCIFIGITPAGISQGKGLDTLAIALGVPEAALVQLVYDRVSNHAVDFQGQRLPTSLLQTKNRSVCPECIASEGHSRWWWEFDFAPICHEHSLRLVDTCGCGKPLTWGDASLGCCKECSVEGLQPELKRDHSEIGEYESWCLRKLGIIGIEGPGTPLLDGLDLRTANHIVESIGVLVEFGFSEYRPVTPSTAEDGRLLRELGFKTISTEGGLEYFGTHLYADFVRSTGKALPERPIEIFGWFATEFQFVRSLYPEFTAALCRTLEIALDIPVTDLFRMDFVSLRTVVISLGIPEELVKDFLLLNGNADALLEHPSGTLIRYDVEAGIRTMAAEMRRH